MTVLNKYRYATNYILDMGNQAMPEFQDKRVEVEQKSSESENDDDFWKRVSILLYKLQIAAE